MPDCVGSLIRHVAAAACLAFTFVPAVSAQAPAASRASADFLTRYDFHLALSALHLANPSLPLDEMRYHWDVHFGGDLDIVDYVSGRTTILIDYEAVLGNERRPFDPNQEYYTLEVSSSVRAGRGEVAGFLHHISRHLGDRRKIFPIAWNTVGARWLQQFAVASTRVDARISAGRIVQSSYVDYTWMADADVTVGRLIRPRFGVFAHGFGEAYGADGTRLERGAHVGGRADAGVRVEGQGGALELFAGYERRLDADPLTLASLRWTLVGVRFVAK